jgi:uncharacterized oxidoreductase
MKLIDRTILITGGSSGIGLELARQLLARGNVVIATGRDRARLDQAASAVPGLHTITADAADAEAIRALHTEVVERFPRLDVLINNAGIMRNMSLLEDRPLEDLTREVGINLEGPMRMVQRFLPDLRRRPESMVVNVTSGLAFVPFKIAPVYSATKAGLHAYTRCLRAQLDGTSVRVVELAPPGTETPLFRGEFEAEMAKQKGMPVAKLVEQAIRGIEAGRPDVRPGLSRVLWLGGRLAPTTMFKQLAKLG